MLEVCETADMFPKPPACIFLPTTAVLRKIIRAVAMLGDQSTEEVLARFAL